jgi:hypothetical protein
MDACVSVISFSSFSFFKKKQENYDLSGYRGQSLLLRIAGRKSARTATMNSECQNRKYLPKLLVFKRLCFVRENKT